MPNIPIHNETSYDLLPWIIDCIKTEAIEYFGEPLHAIRIQLGIQRHAFNPKTREVRYAFYPSDFGLNTLQLMSADANPQDADRLRVHEDGNHHIMSDLIDEAVEVDADFDVMDDLEVLDSDDDVEFPSLDPDFDALDTPDPEFFLEDD
jgi:hypothetical protein